MTRESTFHGEVVLRFGNYELDPTTLELRKSGRKVKLPPQAGRVLSLLVRRAGELVTRAEIKHEIWGEETFVDFGRSLNYCLSCIRSVLNDNPHCPRYIETLPRLGYRFICEDAERAATPKSALAVLPFENLNGDSQQEFIADSMADALITELERLCAARHFTAVDSALQELPHDNC